MNNPWTCLHFLSGAQFFWQPPAGFATRFFPQQPTAASPGKSWKQQNKSRIWIRACSEDFRQYNIFFFINLPMTSDVSLYIYIWEAANKRGDGG